jgi:hypothetical protein
LVQFEELGYLSREFEFPDEWCKQLKGKEINIQEIGF